MQIYKTVIQYLGQHSELERAVTVFGAAVTIPFAAVAMVVFVPGLSGLAYFLPFVFVLPVFAILGVESAVRRERERRE